LNPSCSCHFARWQRRHFYDTPTLRHTTTHAQLTRPTHAQQHASDTRQLPSPGSIWMDADTN